jgi:hypothetical protein
MWLSTVYVVISIYFVISYVLCVFLVYILTFERTPKYFGYLLYNVTTADIRIYMCVILIHMWLSTVYVVIVRSSRELHIYMCALFLVQSLF